MRMFTDKWTRDSVARVMRKQADCGQFDGRNTVYAREYLLNCTAGYYPDGVIIIFSRDTGHHTSGWWKNPDYERCLLLSLSYRYRDTGTPAPRDKKLSALWVEAFFGATKNLVWVEPPYTPEGKKSDVYHYRVFYSPGWVAPILPRGEVYSKDWTPAHWLSYSDVQEQERKQAEQSQP